MARNFSSQMKKMPHNKLMPLKQSQLNIYAPYLEQVLKGRYLSKFCQYSEDVFVFSLSKGGKLVFSLRNSDPKVYISNSFPDGQSFSTPIGATFRKELSNACLQKVSVLGEDRILAFEMVGVNEIFKPTTFTLVAELIPSKANLILLQEDGKILTAKRCTSLLDAHPVLKGLPYLPPEKKGANSNNGSEEFSPAEFIQKCQKEEGSLQETRKKQRFSSLYKHLKTKEKALKRKIDLIEKDESEAKRHLDDGQYGDYIFMNCDAFKDKRNSFEFEGTVVSLDPRKNAAQNAEAFYKRAKKAKATLLLGQENKAKAIKELEGIQRLQSVLNNADEVFLLQAEKEYGLAKVQEKGVSSTPLSGSSFYPMEAKLDGTTYLFGKNARQNDFLSFAFTTNKNYIWMHVKDSHGCHLVIEKENPSDEELSIGCQLTLLGSNLEEGEVMYCPKKNIKKGNALGQVTVKEYHSAVFRRIDPRVKKAFLEAKKVNG